LSIFESGSQIFFSWSTVRHVVHDDRDAIVGDLELGVLNAVLLADGHLLVLLDGTRGVGDVGLAGAEALEAAARARDSDRHLDVGVLRLELLGSSGDERTNRARPVDLDPAGQGLAASTASRCRGRRGRIVFAPAAAGDEN
jgi:hypothetical protein